jgi:hypothetical protein
MAEPPDPETTRRMHRWFAIETNNSFWELAMKSSRSELENRDLLYQAYASAYHWTYADTAINNARAELALAYAHSLLGNGTLDV